MAPVTVIDCEVLSDHKALATSRRVKVTMTRMSLLMGVVLIMMVPVGAWSTASPSLTSAPHPTIAVARQSTELTPMPGSARSVANSCSPPPCVADTLMLLNNTLVPGNFLSGNGIGPQEIAFDSGKGEVFVTDSVTNTVSVVSDKTNSLVATIAVGSYPDGVAYDSGMGEVFVANANSNNVSVISDSTNSVTASISLGTYVAPHGVAYDQRQAKVFVSSYNVQTSASVVSVISDANNTVIATTVGGNAGIVWDSGKGEIFVADFQGGDEINAISDSNYSRVATIIVGLYPYALAYDSGKGEIFVANSGLDNITVVSDATNTVVATVPISAPPYDVAYDSGRSEIFVADGQNISVLSDATNRVVANVTVGNDVRGVAYDSGKGEAFAANQLSNTVSVVSDATDLVVTSVPVGLAPQGVTYDSGKGEIFVANGNDVSIVSDLTNKVIATVPVGLDPVAVVYDSSKGEVFVANQDSDNVSVISDVTNSVVATVGIPTGATGTSLCAIAYDGGRNEVFVANCDRGEVSVIADSNNSVVTSVTAGPGDEPESVVYDSGRNEMFVAKWDPWDGLYYVNALSDLNNSVVASIQVGMDPQGLAYDSAKGEVFVAKSTNVSAIADCCNKVIANTTTGRVPWGATYDAAQGLILVTNSGSDNLSAISDSTDKVVGAVTVGGSPLGVVYDGGNGMAYVANYLQGTVSIISLGNTGGPTITSFTASPPAIPLGGTTYLNVSASGGVGELSYNYTNLPSGCASMNVSSLACKPTAVGTYYVGVVVADTRGSTATSHTNLTVNPSENCNLYSLNITPSSYVLTAGSNVTFIALANNGSPLVAERPSCPAGHFSWSLTNDLGTLVSLPNDCYTNCAVEFIAGQIPGTVDLFVNVTWGGQRIMSPPIPITITAGPVPILSSVSVSPSSDTLQVGGSASFTATPVCSGGTCPAETAYKWSLANSLGNLSSSTGSSVKFTAGTSAGTETLVVNVSLNGKTAKAWATISIFSSTVPTLSSVTITPGSVTVAPGATVPLFTANISCDSSVCQSGTTYAWSLSNSLGTLNSTTGSQVVFSAGPKAGTVTLVVAATLNNKTVQSSPVVITIRANAPASKAGFLGLYGNIEYVLIGGAATVAAAAVALLAFRGRKTRPPSPAKEKAKEEKDSAPTESEKVEEKPVAEPEK